MPDRIDEFRDIEVGNADFIAAITSGAQHAAMLQAHRFRRDGPREPLLDLAFSASLQSVNALLASSAARCRIAPPPPADIEIVTDASGQLIYRCQHAHPHKWKLDGTQLP